MLTFLRLYLWRRKSGATFRTAITRAWAKWREPDPFPANKKGNSHGHTRRTPEIAAATARTRTRLRAGPVRGPAGAAGADPGTE